MLRSILIWLGLALQAGAATIGTFEAPRDTLTYATESSLTTTALGQSFSLADSATLTAITFALRGTGGSVPVSAQVYALAASGSADQGPPVVGTQLAAVGFTSVAATAGTPVVAQRVLTGGILLPAGQYLAILRPQSAVNMSLALLRDGTTYAGGDWARVTAVGNPASLTGRQVQFSQSYDLLFALEFADLLPVPLPPGLAGLAAALLALAWVGQGARRRPAGGVSSANGPPSCPWRSRASWRAAFHRPSRSGARRSGGGWP